MKIFSSLILMIFTIVWILTIGIAGADEKVIGHMHSLENEKLKNSIALTNCDGVRIIEWRTLPSISSAKQSIDIIDRTCVLAVSKFHAFLQKEGIDNVSKEKFTWNIVIIPYDSEYRSLNDNLNRFQTREKYYRSDGSSLLIPGYTQHQLKDIFVVNEILKSDGSANDRFITIFAHEMFHALSYHNGIYQHHSGDKGQKDERLAIKFTMWLGLGK